eukprot:g5203.t1
MTRYVHQSSGPNVHQALTQTRTSGQLQGRSSSIYDLVAWRVGHAEEGVFVPVPYPRERSAFVAYVTYRLYRTWFRIVFGVLLVESLFETPSWCMNQQAEVKARWIRDDFWTGLVLNEERICKDVRTGGRVDEEGAPSASGVDDPPAAAEAAERRLEKVGEEQRDGLEAVQSNPPRPSCPPAAGSAENEKTEGEEKSSGGCRRNDEDEETNYLLSGVWLVNPIWSSLYEIFVVLFILRKAWWRCKYLSYFRTIDLDLDISGGGPQRAGFGGATCTQVPSLKKKILHKKMRGTRLFVSDDDEVEADGVADATNTSTNGRNEPQREQRLVSRWKPTHRQNFLTKHPLRYELRTPRASSALKSTAEDGGSAVIFLLEVAYGKSVILYPRLHLLARAGIMLSSPTLARLLPAVWLSIKANFKTMIVMITFCFVFSWIHSVLMNATQSEPMDRGDPNPELHRPYFGRTNNILSGANSYWAAGTTGNFPGEMVKEFTQYRWTGLLHTAAQVFLCTIIMQFLLATVMNEYSETMKKHHEEYTKGRRKALEAAYWELLGVGGDDVVDEAVDVDASSSTSQERGGAPPPDGIGARSVSHAVLQQLMHRHYESQQMIVVEGTPIAGRPPRGDSISLRNTPRGAEYAMQVQGQPTGERTPGGAAQLPQLADIYEEDDEQICPPFQSLTATECRQLFLSRGSPVRLVASINRLPHFGSVKKEYIELLFVVLDRDNSGLIDLEEWYQICEILQNNFWVAKRDSCLIQWLGKDKGTWEVARASSSTAGRGRGAERGERGLLGDRRQSLLETDHEVLKICSLDGWSPDQKNRHDADEDAQSEQGEKTRLLQRTPPHPHYKSPRRRPSRPPSSKPAKTTESSKSKPVNCIRKKTCKQRLYYFLKHLQKRYVLSGKLSSVMYVVLFLNVVILFAEFVYENSLDGLTHDDNTVAGRKRHAYFSVGELFFSTLFFLELLIRTSTISWTEYLYGSGSGSWPRFDFCTAILLFASSIMDVAFCWVDLPEPPPQGGFASYPGEQLLGGGATPQNSPGQALNRGFSLSLVELDPSQWRWFARYLNLLRLVKLVQLLMKSNSFKVVFTAMEDLVQACEDVAALMFFALFTFSAVGMLVWGGTELGMKNPRIPAWREEILKQQPHELEDARQRLKEFKDTAFFQGGLQILNFNDLPLSVHNCYQIWVNTFDAPLAEAMDLSYPGYRPLCALLGSLKAQVDELKKTHKGLRWIEIPVTSIAYGLVFQTLFFFFFTTVVGNIFVVWLIQVVGCVEAEEKEEEDRKSKMLSEAESSSGVEMVMPGEANRVDLDRENARSDEDDDPPRHGADFDVEQGRGRGGGRFADMSEVDDDAEDDLERGRSEEDRDSGSAPGDHTSTSKKTETVTPTSTARSAAGDRLDNLPAVGSTSQVVEMVAGSPTDGGAQSSGAALLLGATYTKRLSRSPADKAVHILPAAAVNLSERGGEGDRDQLDEPPPAAAARAASAAAPLVENSIVRGIAKKFARARTEGILQGGRQPAPGKVSTNSAKTTQQFIPPSRTKRNFGFADVVAEKMQRRPSGGGSPGQQPPGGPPQRKGPSGGDLTLLAGAAPATSRGQGQQSRTFQTPSSSLDGPGLPGAQLHKGISKAHVFREGDQHQGLMSLGQKLERQGLILRAREGNRSLQERLRKKCLQL